MPLGKFEGQGPFRYISGTCLERDTEYRDLVELTDGQVALLVTNDAAENVDLVLSDAATGETLKQIRVKCNSKEVVAVPQNCLIRVSELDGDTISVFHTGWEKPGDGENH